MATVATLQSLIGGRWHGSEAATPLHSAVNNSLIYHTHAEQIDFAEAVTYARKTGVPAKVRRELSEQEVAWKLEGTRTYQELARRCLAGLEEVAPLPAPEPGRQRLRSPDVRPLSVTKRDAG
jgi:hypothetical protein